MQATHLANPDRFQPVSWAEELAAASEALTRRHQREQAERVAYSALCAGLPSMLVNRYISGVKTLADLLSDAVSNHRVDVPGTNPAELLAPLVADALRSTDKRVQEAAKAFANRVTADYAQTYEVRA